MDEKKLFEAGCFLPSWIEDTKPEPEPMPISQVYTRQHKDLQTLLSELAEIKDHIQDVQERQWNLAKMLHFHENNFVKE
ncbi:hypothetical protein HDR58_01820 [bacterium]|nr:hypothetical protein [bacterium]